MLRSNYWILAVATFLSVTSTTAIEAFSRPILPSHNRAWQIRSCRSTVSRQQPLLIRTRTLAVRGGEQEATQEGTADEELIPAAESTHPDESSAVVEKTCMCTPSIAINKMVGMFATLGQHYAASIEKSPIMTKSATAGIIFWLSDYLAQRLEQRKESSKSLDATRLWASALVGFLYFGPAAHFWYEWIFALLPSTSLASTLQKAFLGQILFGPSFTCIFFGVGLLQSGKFSLGAWWRKIRSDLPGAWLAGAGFWPLVDLISYSVVPVKFIPLFVNLCSLVWTVYLSLIANREQTSQAPHSS